MTQLNQTHDAQLTSWVPSAQALGCDFPIQNLPFGRFQIQAKQDDWRIGVAIGDQILDLRSALSVVAWPAEVARMLGPLAAGDLNAHMAESSVNRSALRAALSTSLQTGSAHQAALAKCLVAQSDAQMSVPCRIGDYTDFFTSIHHATSVGKLFRPDNPLLPNYKYVPIGYHGRASSINVSGTNFKRPLGQILPPGQETPVFAPSKRLDYELELAAYIRASNVQGEPISMVDAEDALFGLGLLNDWSARDVQAWEYQPLGPFLAKSFASTVSPWVVTMEALAPFRLPFTRAEGDPQPMPYLTSKANSDSGAINITLEVWLQTKTMADAGAPAARLSTSNFAEASYWTLAQLVAHHTVNGCNLQVGDMFGSGTQSGPKLDEGGSLLELSKGGKQPVELPNGERRTFLEDGDTVILRGYCQSPDGSPSHVRIGLGEVRATVLPARVG
ncbi:MAG: fumarylacetoacetase [Cytophagales bacterium]|nr:fumarylacetoacetase [Cytophagales bacterium]